MVFKVTLNVSEYYKNCLMAILMDQSSICYLLLLLQSVDFGYVLVQWSFVF